MQEQSSFPQLFPENVEKPLPPPQQHNNKIIRIILHPHPLLLSWHPQFVAVKSLIWLPPNYCYNHILCDRA